MAMRLDSGPGTTRRTSSGGYSSWATRPGTTIYGPYRPSVINDAAARGVTLSPVSQRTVTTYNGGGGSGGSAPRASGSGSGGGGGTSRSGGGSSYDPNAAARRTANNSARSSANEDIQRLNDQITIKSAQRGTNQKTLDALKDLVGTGLGKARDTQLATIDQSLKTKLEQIQQTFDAGITGFRENLRDNEQTEADASFANMANRARERGDLVTQALSQGAGESDILQSQMQALRNWAANQGDVNRSFFDTRQSINSGISDLNTATRTSRINEETSANDSRSKVWDSYYDSRADALTQMANLDQQNYLLDNEIAATERQKAQQTGLVSWLDSGKNYEDYVAPTSMAAASAPAYTSDYARQAAEAAGSSWKSPGISKETEQFKGEGQSTGSLNSSSAAAGAGNTSSRKKPEGASLRKW
jgi:hypothetical protein